MSQGTSWVHRSMIASLSDLHNADSRPRARVRTHSDPGRVPERAGVEGPQRPLQETHEPGQPGARHLGRSPDTTSLAMDLKRSVCPLGQEEKADNVLGSGDRKSTRLNSSH